MENKIITRADGKLFNPTLAERAVTFINMLKHTKGEFHGKPFNLIDWQKDIITDVFGTVKANGYRQYNTAYIEIPKKQGKSELAAAVALYLLAGDGEWGAEVYGCASEMETLRTEVSNRLSEYYNMTYEEAIELYRLKDRDDYTIALKMKMKELGIITE